MQLNPLAIQAAEELGIHPVCCNPFDNTLAQIVETVHEVEEARNIVNEWIRSSNRFDAVIDFDTTMQNPEDPLTIQPAAHSGDFLHPNESGYKMMGEVIDLKLFE